MELEAGALEVVRVHGVAVVGAATAVSPSLKQLFWAPILEFAMAHRVGCLVEEEGRLVPDKTILQLWQPGNSLEALQVQMDLQGVEVAFTEVALVGPEWGLVEAAAATLGLFSASLARMLPTLTLVPTHKL